LLQTKPTMICGNANSHIFSLRSLFTAKDTKSTKEET